MPRWPKGYVPKLWQKCPVCGGKKDFNAKACRKCSPKQRRLLGVKGPAHPTWKGGKQIDRDGYIRLYLPDHPWPRKGGYVLEHVAVMELHISRRIKAGEVVHHINGNRQDNRLGNLELMSAGAHSAHHRSLDCHKRKHDPATGRFLRKEVEHAS